MFNKQIALLRNRNLSQAAASISLPSSEVRRASKVPSIVSVDLTVNGDVEGVGDLQIEGKVVGRVEVANLVIAESGRVEGEIVAKAVAISGELRGTVRAGSISLTATAKVEGDVLYDKLAIESGAQIEGQCRRIYEKQGDKLLPLSDQSPAQAVE